MGTLLLHCMFQTTARSGEVKALVVPEAGEERGRIISAQSRGAATRAEGREKEKKEKQQQTRS